MRLLSLFYVRKGLKMKKTLLLIILLSTTLWSNFNFGECSGSGTFEQQIVQFSNNYENTTIVGEIPSGIQGLKIFLISDNDVDIRLYGENNDKIVHWPHGIHNQSNQETKPYKNIDVTYSGYNGVDGQLGHEFIEINGTTPTAMTMKAFGYRAGYATVNYSWTGKDGCEIQTSGNGNFTQILEQNTISLIGTVPPNVNNVKIILTSVKDLDIQLYGTDGTAIVSWKPQGLLSESAKQSIIYHDMNITWSGYNGTGGQAGHEYIKITGLTTEMLVMKVFGYEAGTADVNYSWGDEGINTIPVLSESDKQIYLETINSARAIARVCGDYGYFPATTPVVWSNKLYNAGYEHSQDMTIMDYFSHTGSGAESDWSGYALSKQSTPKDRIENYNFNWTRYSENIAAGTNMDTAQKAINAWLNSPGHCKNIMDPNVTKVGLAHIESSEAYYTHYWTQNFGRGN